QDIGLNDEVENMSIGYYTTVANEDERDTFVFVPTWQVVVSNKKNDDPEKNYYVNAIEKTVFSDTEESIESEQEEKASDQPDPSKPKTGTSDE
ncbi:two-component system regulatory protein YycI, partial [Micrococcus sp. SIMBA_131]